MRYRSYDLDELLAYAAQGLSASAIIEQLGLSISERTVRYLIHKHFGKRPTLREIRRADPLRQVVSKLMIADGKNPHVCSRCGRSSIEPLAIHATCVDPDVKDLVFVCVTRCATVADN